VIFFASYLVEKRELLSVATRRVGQVMLPDPRHLGPLLLVVFVIRRRRAGPREET